MSEEPNIVDYVNQALALGELARTEIEYHQILDQRIDQIAHAVEVGVSPEEIALVTEIAPTNVIGIYRGYKARQDLMQDVREASEGQE